MKRIFILASVASLLSVTSPAWAQLATLFLDNGFENDTVGAAPNTPTTGSWIPTAGATVTNDVAPGPFAGTNYLRIQRTDGGQNSARIDASFDTVTTSNTLTITFAYLYESSGGSESTIELYSGTIRRVAILASPDLSGDPSFTPTNFYTLDGNYLGQVNSSLAVTPGTWQTIKIEYMSGSPNLTLTVNGTPETLMGAVTPGTVNRIRFQTGNTYTTYDIDGEIKVEATTNVFPSPLILFRDNFQTDTATNGLTLSTDDFDPVIGAGDIGGSWTIYDGTAANHYPAAVQVLNDNPPDSQVIIGTPGTNNFLRIYRAGSANFSGKPYATGWNTASTSNQVVQLDMRLWQEQYLGQALSPAYMSVMFGGAPQVNPTQAAWLNTVGAWPSFSDGTADSLDFPDNQWNTVRIVANLSSTDTQQGLLPQTYSVSVNNVTVTNNAVFYTAQNTVQSILVVWNGINEHYSFIDDVTIRIVPPLTVSIETLPDKNPQLTFTGNPGSSYVVQTATNLTDWIPISTNTADGTTGQFIYPDLTATNFIQRFYRGVSQ